MIFQNLPMLYTQEILLLIVLISEKLKLIHEQHISCKMNVELENIHFIRNIELCSLLGNLLDNCIELPNVVTRTEASPFAVIRHKIIFAFMHPIHIIKIKI